MNTKTFFDLYQKYFDDEIFLQLIDNDNSTIEEFVEYLKQEELKRVEATRVANRKLRHAIIERNMQIYEQTGVNPIKNTNTLKPLNY